MGNKIAPNARLPVLVMMVRAKKAASVRSAPAPIPRIIVSLVDMKSFSSPASIIFFANSRGCM